MFAQRLVTAEEFARMPAQADARFELIRGRVVRVIAPGPKHAWLAMRLGSVLTLHVEANQLGAVLDPAGFRLETDPDTIRIPDLAFVAAHRIPPEGLGDKPLDRPDLAIEILSPNDRGAEIRDKVAQYLAAGVRIVWVLDPRRETVTVHRPGAMSVRLSAGDVLDGAEVVPGFCCPLDQIFRAR